MPDPAGHLLSWALCRPDDVRVYLDREIGADREGLLVALINQFSEMAKVYTGRDFVKKERTETFNGPARRIVVNAPPIDRSVAVTVKDGTVTLKAGTNYLIDYEAGVIARNDGGEFSRGQDTISVTYTGGLVTETTQGGGDGVPFDLKGAAAMQVAWWFRNRSELGAGQLSFSGAGAIRIPSPAELLPPVRNILESYRIFEG